MILKIVNYNNPDYVQDACTALYVAAEMNSVQCVQVLLSNGAELNVKNNVSKKLYSISRFLKEKNEYLLDEQI